LPADGYLHGNVVDDRSAYRGDSVVDEVTARTMLGHFRYSVQKLGWACPPCTFEYPGHDSPSCLLARVSELNSQLKASTHSLVEHIRMVCGSNDETMSRPAVELEKQRVNEALWLGDIVRFATAACVNVELVKEQHTRASSSGTHEARQVSSALSHDAGQHLTWLREEERHAQAMGDIAGRHCLTPTRWTRQQHPSSGRKIGLLEQMSVFVLSDQATYLLVSLAIKHWWGCLIGRIGDELSHICSGWICRWSWAVDRSSGLEISTCTQKPG
jgi:hypothetical protein